jgi:hypothetical protein
MQAHNGVIASMGYLAIVEKKIVNSFAKFLQGFVVIFYYGLVWRICASHDKGWFINPIEEHVVQARVWEHNAKIVQARSNQI